MPLSGKSRQRRHGFALAAGGQQEELGGRDLLHIGERHDHAIRHRQETELARRLEVLLQAAPDDGDAAPELSRHADQMLHALDVGREVRDHDSGGGVAEDPLERAV